MSKAERDIKIVRNLDSLGRLVIPVEIRREMGVSTGDPIQMRVEGERVIIERHEDSCLMCGNTGTVFEIKNEKKLCKKCIKEIKNKEI